MDWTADYHAIIAKASEKPQYPHDCKVCEFKGRFGKYDVYVCRKNGMMDSLIARYGKDAEYFSMPRAAFARAAAAVINGEVAGPDGKLVKDPTFSEAEMAILARVFSGKEE